MKSTSVFDRIMTIILVLICIGLLAIVGYRFLGKSEQLTGVTPSMRVEQQLNSKAINVSVSQVKHGTFTRMSTLGAEISNSRDLIAIPASITGEITELFVSKGQTIDVGDSIATIDPSTAGSKYKSTTVTSPISGKVYEIPSYLGQHISNNATLITLGMTGDLIITASISERFLSTLKEGLKATFTTAAWPDEEASATLVDISPNVNTTNRTVEITLKIENADTRLKEGMFVSLSLITEQQENVITIPTDAITTYLGEPIVYIVEEGKAKRVSITTRASDNNRSVVASGLEGGEMLITAGSVIDGTEVTIIKENI